MCLTWYALDKQLFKAKEKEVALREQKAHRSQEMNPFAPESSMPLPLSDVAPPAYSHHVHASVPADGILKVTGSFQPFLLLWAR